MDERQKHQRNLMLGLASDRITEGLLRAAHAMAVVLRAAPVAERAQLKRGLIADVTPVLDKMVDQKLADMDRAVAKVEAMLATAKAMEKEPNP